jgi:KDO2-lipid IV(A) lauroyltransferase
VKERAVAAGYAVAWSTVTRAPAWLPRHTFQLLADGLYRRDGRTARQLRANLRRVVGPDVSAEQLDDLTHKGMRSYLRYWLEVFRLPAISAETLLGETYIEGTERLQAAYAERTGVILALPHMGNWDAAGAWCMHLGMPFTTVAERLRPASLFDRFVAFRESLGMEVLALTGSGAAASPYRTLRTRLESGGMLCLLADRDLTASGTTVDFFGEPARMPAGPAALAVDTGALLLPVTLWFPEDGEPGWRGQIHDPVRVPTEGDRQERVAAMTQTMADTFAGSIAMHPTDWHMVQRVWIADMSKVPAAA